MLGTIFQQYSSFLDYGRLYFATGTVLKRPFFPRDYTKFPANRRDEFSIKVTSLDKTLRLTVDYVIVYITEMAARFGSTDADEFTLQQQNAKTKAATKYAVKVISDFMLEKNYDGEIGTMDIVVLNGILQD